MKKIIFFFAIAFFTVAGISCEKKAKVEENKPVAFSATPKISDILSNEDAYLSKEVTVNGQFMGWSGGVGGPPVTKSDWVLKDDTGSIYVVGPYPPGCIPPDTGIGTKVKINGIVKITAGKQVYIQLK